MLNRREFGKTVTGGVTGLAVLATVGGSLELEGCSVFNDILNWIPVGQEAVSGLVSILEAGGYINPAAAAIVATINAGFTQLEADIKAYEAITPAPVGALAKIEAGFGVIVSNLQAFLSAVNLPDSPLLTTVLALAQVIFSTIAAFKNQLPVAVKTMLASSTFKLSGKVYAYAPKHRTRRAFKKDWNSIARAGGHPEIQMHVSFFEHF